MLKRLTLLALVLTVAMLAAACDQPSIEPPIENPIATTSPTAPETTVTNPPETTTPPDSPDTTVPAEEGDGTTPWWLLILGLIALVAIIVAFVSRGSKKPVAVVAGALTWKDHARNGYAGARWAYDALSEDIAIWRGNAQFDGVTSVGQTASTGHAETWGELADRINAARDSLYALEAASPDPRTADTARATITAMMGLRDAVDSRAEARFAYRTAESVAGDDPNALIEARDREVRASTNYSTARNGLATSLNALAAVVA